MGRFATGNPGRPKGAKGKRAVLLAAFNRSVLESAQYRQAFKKRLVDGTATSAEVSMAYYYGYGKPSDKVDLRVSNQVSATDLVNVMTPAEAAIMSKVLARLEEEDV